MDNHLRPLVLALIAAQYVHTSTEHAESMLGTAEQLAAGLGARPKNAPKVPSSASDTSKADNPKSRAKVSTDDVGNAHLRLWIGERALGALQLWSFLWKCYSKFSADHLPSLELKRRSADEQGASKQVVVNDRLRDAVVRVQKRKFAEME